LVGTAFDYAVRFELQRMHGTAKVERWVAEKVVEDLEIIAGRGTLERVDDEGNVISSIDGQLAERWLKIVREARAALASYVRQPEPDADARKEMASHALRLARLDPYLRAGIVDEEPERVEDDDLSDILELLRIVPWKDLGSPTVLWLNPRFGAHSKRVGGADCDLISGARLLDLKVVTTPNRRADLRQLLAYLILARAARESDPAFPLIDQVGIYYARHRELWLLPVSDFKGRYSAETLSRRFFKMADAHYKGRAEARDSE
jgi:hypothetical protein